MNNNTKKVPAEKTGTFFAQKFIQSVLIYGGYRSLREHHIQFYAQLDIQAGLPVIQRDFRDFTDAVHAVEHGFIVYKQLFGCLA